MNITYKLGRDSVGDTATRYGLNGPGIEFLWGRIFCTRPYQLWGPPNLLHNGYRVIPREERPKRGVNHPPQSSAEVKERVDLYLYATVCALMTGYWGNF
jgi:hypothetical protein